MSEAKASAASRNLAQRIADIARWDEAEKCILLSLATLPFVLMWTLRIVLARGHPQVAPYLDRGFLPWMLGYEATQVGGFSLLAGLGWVLRRRPGPRPWLMYLMLQFWYLSQAFALYAMGPYSSPFALISLMFTAACMLVHELRPIVYGLVSFAVFLAVTTVLERLGLLPYAPLLGASLLRPATGWLVSVGVTSMFASGILLFLFAHVVSDWRERERVLRELSTTDELTRVANRREFMHAVPPHFAQAQARAAPLSVVLVDVDHFKRINDEHGHLAGDRVLVAVAEALRQEVRAQDVVARIGGEEFALLLPGTDAEGARAVAERCRARIAQQRSFVDGVTLSVTVSLGVASAPHPDVARVEHLLRLADAALYRAKAEGRNLVRLVA